MTVSAEGEIGDTPINDLLSKGRNLDDRVRDASNTSTRTMFCTPCTVESEVEGGEEYGILESHHMVPVDDRTGALPFNQKGVDHHLCGSYYEIESCIMWCDVT